MRKTEELALSGKELVAYLKKYKNGTEFVAGVNEDCREFVKDVETLTNNISNLYEVSKVPLAVAGVVVKVEVIGAGQQLFAARIGDAGSADALKDMMKKMAE